MLWWVGMRYLAKWQTLSNDLNELLLTSILLGTFKEAHCADMTQFLSAPLHNYDLLVFYTLHTVKF